METATIIINVLTLIGAAGAIATPFLGIALASTARFNRQLVERNAAQGVTIAGLERRLADVSAIRRAPPAHLAVMLDAAKLLRGYEAHHDSEAARLLDSIHDADGPGRVELEQRAAERGRKADRNRAMAERLEAVVIETPGGTVGVPDGSGRPVRSRPACGTSVAPAGWYCSRAMGHDGPCAAHPRPVPSPDFSRLGIDDPESHN